MYSSDFLEQLKVLVVGGGSIGRRHIKNLIGLQVGEVIVHEPVPSRAAEIENGYHIRVFEELPLALDHKPDAALICSPPAMHLEQALAAATAGCHTFIEKPLAHNSRGLEEFCLLTESSNIITMVGYNWRFHPAFQQMKILLDEQAIGRVLVARVNCGQYLPDWHPWEDYRHGYSARRLLGGGILLDSHELDYLTWFLGEVVQCSCVASKVSDLEIDTEDVADLILVFQSGTHANLHFDYIQYPAGRSYEFYGPEGSIHWDLVEGLTLYKRGTSNKTQFPLPSGFDLNDTYVDEMKHFLECIYTGEPSFLNARRGKYIMELSSIAIDSAHKLTTALV